MGFCTNCGAELDDGARFCINCGAPVEDPGASGTAGSDDGFGFVEETAYVEADVTRVAPPLDPTAHAGSTPSQGYAPTNLPPTMPAGYPEQPQPPAPRQRSNTGAIIGITLGIVAAVLVVGFGIFYFTNPFGLTEGIFANSAAAQAAAAEEAQAQADETQAQLEEAQKETEELQRQLDEANRQGSDSTTYIVVPDSEGSSGSTSQGGSYITAPSGYPSVRVSSGGEVLPGSGTRTITRSDIANLNDWELAVARNEIIARHGYSFKRDDLRQYFLSTPWYSPDPNYSDSEVSKLEWDNMNTILALEHERGSQYTED